MSLVVHYWIGDLEDSQGVSIFQNVIFNCLTDINHLTKLTFKGTT